MERNLNLLLVGGITTVGTDFGPGQKERRVVMTPTVRIGGVLLHLLLLGVGGWVLYCAAYNITSAQVGIRALAMFVGYIACSWLMKVVLSLFYCLFGEKQRG